MKITKKQLVDEIVALLVERGAVQSSEEEVHQDALDFVRGAIVPALKELAARGAYDRK